jgi:hypothetical protein
MKLAVVCSQRKNRILDFFLLETFYNKADEIFSLRRPWEKQQPQS